MPIDGILGISLPNNSFIGADVPFYWNLYYKGKLPSPVFSFYMNPGKALGGELTLGGIDSSRYEGNITYIALNKGLSTSNSQYMLDQLAVYINDAIFRSSSTGAAYPAGVAILDSGTAFIQAPDASTVKTLYSQISSQIRQIDPAGAWGAPCSILDSVAPQLTFTVGSGNQKLNLTIPKSYFNLGEYPGQPGTCQALFNTPMEPASVGSKPTWIIGSPVLKAYYTIWDAVNLKIGFAKPAVQT
jgi:hypothetical protein